MARALDGCVLLALLLQEHVTELSVKDYVVARDCLQKPGCSISSQQKESRSRGYGCNSELD
eukprot:5895028-Pyramimonas_sp.AAC.1